MKSIVNYIVTLFCMACVVACQDDEWAQQAKGVDLSRPVSVSLNFGVPQTTEVSVTKAGNSESDILDTGIRIYVFNMSGKYLRTEDITGNLIDNGSDDEGHHYSATDVTLYVGTQKVYALANITESGYFENATSLLTNLQTAAENSGEEGFLKTYFDLAQETINSNGFPQFSGGYMPLSGYGEITVNSNGSTNDQVKMKRLVSEIKFNINTETKNSDGHTVTFTPQTYTFYNIPRQGFLLEDDARDELCPADGEDNFYNAEPVNIGVASEGVATFDEYIPESIRKYKTKCSTYNDRESFTGQGSEKDWTCAPQYGMYVVLSGRYSETKADGTLYRYGDVDYIIHMGNFNNSLDDYSVKRNTIYTYTVTVKGVDNIIVEVVEKKLDQNAAEGDIIELDDASQVFNLDAHYEQVYVEFNLSSMARKLLEDASQGDLDQLIGNSFMLYFRSPFNTVQEKVVRPYQETNEASSMSGIDYKWVEFLPQSTERTISTYPGRNNSRLLSAWSACKKMGEALKQLCENQSNIPTVEGLTISTNDDGDYEARFTIFVDEYFYQKDLGGNAVGWKDFTNQEDRVLMIASDMEISQDQNSSYSKALTYLSQASIETFYNVDTDNALGVESYNENGSLDGFGTIYTTGSHTERYQDEWGQWQTRVVYEYADNWVNGRQNMIYNIFGQYTLPSGKDWDNFSRGYGPNIHWEEIGYVEDNATSGNKPLEGGINGHYTRAYNACLTRNRDLNGDGKIDENEVRWYMPAVSQYLRIGIGSRALSAETRLYMGDKSVMTKDGYPQDYVDNGSVYWVSNKDRSFYWAVEVGAYGSISGNKAQVRCVRNLPKRSLMSNEEAPVGDDALAGPIYGEVKTINDGDNYLFDFGDGGLVPSIFRNSSQPQQRPYVAHNEDDDANNLPNAFVVAKRYIREQDRWGNWQIKTFNSINKGYSLYNDPCNDYSEYDGAVGWRTPNLSELMIMAQAEATHDNLDLLDNSNNTATSTSFSNEDVRPGFYYNGNFITANEVTSGYVRCVRDATQAERNAAQVVN